MKTLAVLILVFILCRETETNENDDKGPQHSGSTSCSNICSLMSMSEKMGGLVEKIANMESKISFLETSLQNTEKEVLELRSLAAGKIP